jgi:hypothetical protein
MTRNQWSRVRNNFETYDDQARDGTEGRQETSVDGEADQLGDHGVCAD